MIDFNQENNCHYSESLLTIYQVTFLFFLSKTQLFSNSINVP